MPRQVPTKVGDVFKVTESEGKNCLVQFVAIDAVNLNSDMVAVFPGETEGTYADAVAKEPLFYTHTTVSEGVRRGLWEKVGEASVTLDLAAMLFKNFHGDDEKEAVEAVGDLSLMPPVPYPNWTVWSALDQEWRYVPLEDGKALQAEDGGITPPEDIVYRIAHGESGFQKNWPS